MRRQMLGKSMLEVPVVAAGCMRIQGMDETEVDEYIHTCLELGIQFFDHADIYGKGACESLVRTCIRADRISQRRYHPAV